MRFLALLIFISSISCRAQYDGVYIDKGENLYQLVVKDNFFIYKLKSRDREFGFCNDTLAYGTISKVKDLPLLKFSSFDNQYSSYLNMKVKEHHGENGVLRFKINNPIELKHALYNSNNDNARIIEYSLIIQTDCLELEKNVNQMIFNTNAIVIPNSDNCTIRSFEIIAHPKNYSRDWREESQPRSVYTFEYNVSENGSNDFSVEIDGLTPCFIAAQRLSGDFVLINKDKSLEWNNRVFVKSK
jgi:hypothetical protein